MSFTSSKAPYSVCVGHDLDKMIMQLPPPVVTFDTKTWLEENSAEPPFLIVALQPTNYFPCRGTHWVPSDDKPTEVLDGYQSAIDLLDQLEREIANRAVLRLLLALKHSDEELSLRRVGKPFEIGIDRRSRFLTNNDSRMWARFVRIESVTEERLRKALKQLDDEIPELSAQSAQLAVSGHHGEDNTSKFLSLFTCIEKVARAKYKILFDANNRPPPLDATNLPPQPDLISPEQFAALHANPQDAKSPRDRFIAGSFYWDRIDADDIDTFISLTGDRNKLAHGRLKDPIRNSHVEQAQIILKNLLGVSSSGADTKDISSGAN